MKSTKTKTVLVFKTTIPVFSWYIAKGMGFGLLLFVFIFGFIAAPGILDGNKFSDFTPDIYFAFGFVGLIFILTYIVMAIMFPNGFVSRITIDKKGISQVSLSPTKKVNRAAIVGGLLTKTPGAVGAGLLAEAGDNRFMGWKEIKIVKIDPKSHYMYFSRGRFTLFPIAFFCPQEYFAAVTKAISRLHL